MRCGEARVSKQGILIHEAPPSSPPTRGSRAGRAVPPGPRSRGCGTCVGDAKGQRKPPGRPVSKARLTDGRRPIPHPHLHAPRVRPSAPWPGFPRPPRALLLVAPATLNLSPPSGPRGRRPSLAGRVPAPRGGPGLGGRRTPTLVGRPAPGDHLAETRRRGGRGSLAGGRGAVPRHSGGGTPPWCLVLSSGAERWAGGDPRPRAGLRGSSASVQTTGRPP